MEILWNKEQHSVGFELLDNQHKELFSIAQSLQELSITNYTPRDVLLIIKRLFSYTNYHFLSEEELFIKYTFPNEIEHKKKHKVFTDLVRDTFYEIKDGKLPDISKILDFILNWIEEHISIEDRQYATFFRQNSIDIDSDQISEKSDTTETQKDLPIWQQRKLKLDIYEIDNQHKELVCILQQLSDLNRSGVSLNRVKIQLSLILKKLYYYSSFHFELEESLMKKNGYPELKKHKEMHKSFMNHVKSFMVEYQQGIASLTDEMIIYLKDWTINHILKDDADIKKHIDSI